MLPSTVDADYQAAAQITPAPVAADAPRPMSVEIAAASQALQARVTTTTVAEPTQYEVRESLLSPEIRGLTEQEVVALSQCDEITLRDQGLVLALCGGSFSRYADRARRLWDADHMARLRGEPAVISEADRIAHRDEVLLRDARLVLVEHLHEAVPAILPREEAFRRSLDRNESADRKEQVATTQAAAPFGFAAKLTLKSGVAFDLQEQRLGYVFGPVELRKIFAWCAAHGSPYAPAQLRAMTSRPSKFAIGRAEDLERPVRVVHMGNLPQPPSYGELMARARARVGG